MGSNPIFSATLYGLRRGIAQLVEQWSPKPRAQGSNPCAPATFFRGVAQFGSAPALGAGGLGFKSLHPDQVYVLRAFSSVGQSNRLITGVSRVQVPEGPPYMPR